MAGNRKYGFLRGNKGGFKPMPWFCVGCKKLHLGQTSRNETLDGRNLCDNKYNKELSIYDKK